MKMLSTIVRRVIVVGCYFLAERLQYSQIVVALNILSDSSVCDLCKSLSIE